jgi:hypothetical protein
METVVASYEPILHLFSGIKEIKYDFSYDQFFQVLNPLYHSYAVGFIH